jgi:DNA-binding response OmpR family regulator
MAKKILIIEDEEVLLDLLAKKLRGSGYFVYTASNGEEGMEKADSLAPDLIILDMMMPKLDGFGVLERLKKEGKKFPVLIISNSGQEVDIDRALSLGAIDYLVKTELGPEEIMQKVKKCLRTGTKSENCNIKEAMRILIAEDDNFLRELCAKKLNKMGYCIDTAVDGEECLEKIKEFKPDLLLLDIIMPNVSGLEVLKSVRADKDKTISKVPVVIMSNLGQEADVENARSLGADEYLIKAHFTTDDIAEKIKKFLSN